MKRYLWLLLASICLIANAQNAIPNPGFETWNFNPNYDDPQGWGTLNPLTYSIAKTATKATAAADIHSGTAALKLESKSMFIQTAPGIAGLGTITQNTDGAEDFKGVAYNKRPISFTGWYKYQPNGADTASIEIVLFKWNTGTQSRQRVGEAIFEQHQTVNSYAQFNVPITYNMPDFPDTMVIILLTSSQGDQSPVGSKLFVDDLDLVLCNPNYTATTTSTNATCTANNGSATVASANGTPPYSFNWSTGGFNNQITNVTAGTYSVTVTDGNGCSVTTSATINANSNPLTVTTSSTPSSCASATGSVTASATGGAQPYTYLWSESSTTSTVSNLGAGSYSVTIRDSNGCSGTGTASVTTPNGPSATSTVTDVDCNGNASGAISVTVTGGTGPLTYLWNDAVTTEDRTGLSAGTYSLTITDANSCAFIVAATVTAPSALAVANPTITNVLCNGGNDGSVTLNITGGTPPYTPTWSSGTGVSLAAGTYTITITDANSCSASLSLTVTEPAALGLSLTAVNATSASANDGSVSAATTGGTPAYSYLWNTNATTQNLTNVGPGVYCLTATDNNGCTITACDTVSAPSAVGDFGSDIVKLYPNPASNLIMLETTEGNFMFSIYNLEGRLVEERSILGVRTLIEVRNLSTGLYTYQLHNQLTDKTSYGQLQIEK